MTDSRFSGLYKLTMAERIDALGKRGWLQSGDVAMLRLGQQVLVPAAADRMVENVLGTFGLPLAIAPNFVVNERSYLVPMVVEEPSVVAGVSAAAKLAHPDGFSVAAAEALLAGQIHVTEIADVGAAIAALEQHRDELIAAADAIHPRLAQHGGGARELEIRQLELADGRSAIAVHLLVDTGDAMGANIVNTMCESLAPRIGALCRGNIALRILSNLSDRSLVHARVTYSLDRLATSRFAAEQVRDRIVTASEIAIADSYRAATHNKGIMNGIDALAIATGNDWRAIEAGAHAYAARDGQYRSLARWSVDTGGDLQGEMSLPLRLATVGGTAHVNPAATLALGMTGARSARELSCLAGAVGLAQNFAAIKALATHGIQEGHMKLHARSAVSMTAPDEPLDDTIDKPDGSAAAKIILLGEHAVVYGAHALALPIPDAVSARIVEDAANVDSYCGKLLRLICRELDIGADGFGVDVCSTVPVGMGLGSSAAIAVAIIRALNSSRGLGLDDERVNAIALQCERVAHGTPSGIDNSIATYAAPMLFRSAGELQIEMLKLGELPPIVIAFSDQPGSTLQQVAAVRSRYEAQREHYEAIFAQIGALSLAGAAALQDADHAVLGALMNMCHGLLNAIEVSTPDIENIVSIARDAGAAGAKLTGGGGGGSVVALCPGAMDAVEDALASAGYTSRRLQTRKET